MKYKPNIKILFLLLAISIMAFSNQLKAQEIYTYYVFSPDIMDVRALDMDSSGNFFFVCYDQNYRTTFSKLSSDGVMSTIANGEYYHPESITVDKAGNVVSARRSGGISDACVASTSVAWVKKYVKAERANTSSTGSYKITF